MEGDTQTASDELLSARSAYVAAFGKPPHHKWGAPKIRALIASPPPAEPPPAPLPGVRVMILTDHVYLPADPTQEGWETSTQTVKVDGETDGRRTKITVHPALAEFLQNRKQAEILD